MNYSRDARSPVPKNNSVSRTMSSNKGKDTLPELILRKMLRASGAGGYRLHWNVPGKPDIAYPSKRIAIFVNGCFWHRCPVCDLPLPKNNVDFWSKKFERNIERDSEKQKLLEDAGWTVVTIWECELKNDPDSILNQILPLLFNNK